MLKTSVQFGHAAQKLGLVDGELAFPLLAPMRPVRPDIFRCRQPDERAVVLVERFQQGVDGGDGGAVEFYLLPDVPIQKPRSRPLDGLEQRVEGARRPRVYRADGRHLGFGRVAGVEDRQQIGQGNVAG